MTSALDFDIEKARADTPGCKHVVHFNNAGASLMPLRVLDTVLRHYELEARMGGYEAADQSQAQIEKVYQSAAKLIRAQPDEIAIVENATRAWDMAFYSIPFQPGDRILTARAAYASNFIAFLQAAQRHSLQIDVIPDDANGQVSLDALENMLDERVRLVAITHVPTNGGLVNPAESVGKITRAAGIYYLLDACQSVGQMPVDVDEIGCDMLSTTSRKFLRGPRGMGFLYVRRERIQELIPPILDLHAASWISKDRFEIRKDAQRFENWERNYAALLGMGAAIDYAMEWGLPHIWSRIHDLGEYLRSKLAQLPGVMITDKGKVRCGIVTFTVAGRTPGDIQKILREKNINISTSTVFSTRLDMEQRGLGELVRASLHYYNTRQEIDFFCSEILAILS
jgi:cysteine desulfurase/selenocysteine lyase